MKDILMEEKQISSVGDKFVMCRKPEQTLLYFKLTQVEYF